MIILPLGVNIVVFSLSRIMISQLYVLLKRFLLSRQEKSNLATHLFQVLQPNNLKSLDGWVRHISICITSRAT